MKAGDLVIIKDYSYSKEVEDGVLVDNTYRGDKQFIIVETNCVFPNPHEYQLGYTFNNTVIQAVDSGKVIFIEERFLKLTTHKITIDGKTIEISNESYQALKKSLK